MHLWPRQEVLQLLTPQLSARVGGATSNALIYDVVRQLGKSQSAEGKVSFDRWLVVAKEHLKWNDSCIKLLWDMLDIATFYFQNKKDEASSVPSSSSSSSSSGEREDKNSVEFNFLVIFVILHVSEPLRPHSPSVIYDAVWPGQDADSSRSDPKRTP